MDDHSHIRPTLKNGADREAQLPRSLEPSKPAEFQFERPDWFLFLSIDTLSQKAGVPRKWLRRLVLKELTDNALDSGARYVSTERIGPDTYTITDDGPGIPGTPEEIARLFSINRPLVSSKLWRLPSRGAMGNGLRVVAGAVAASDGKLRVWTRNRLLVLEPQDDGTTAVKEVDEVDFPVGTRIEITFGPTIPQDLGTLLWAHEAIRMADAGESYTGKASPWWYDGDHFFQLFKAEAGNRPVRDLIANLDGCSGAKAGRIAAPFKGMRCGDLTYDQANQLLLAARAEARPVRPERLGCVGQVSTLPPSYACERGTIKVGGREPKAEVPFVIEAWAHTDGGSDDKATIRIFVNRTPVTGDVRAYKSKADLDVYGCGLAHRLKVPRGRLDIVLNLTTPYCPITTDGKEPDLTPFVQQIQDAIDRAAKRARRAIPKEPQSDTERLTQKSVILDRLQEGIAKASGNGQYRFNQRQLFYVIRPFVMEATGEEPGWKNFCGVITDYEAANGDIPGMFRDPRGSVYHPHTGETIQLGTLEVEAYSRPEWTFNMVLVIEKEGFFEALKEARWPERWDCALMTSKGYTTRALRDLIDLLGESDEPLRVACIHDADAAGTMILQTLQEETAARGRRRVQILNWGLDPWEALAMGLAVETVKREGRAAVADYVRTWDALPDEEWEEWLQGKRVELNAMTTEQLIAWLDSKMERDSLGKVIPPEDELVTAATAETMERVRREITEQILREAGIDSRVAEAMHGITIPAGTELKARVAARLSEKQDAFWRELIEDIAATLAQRHEGEA